MDVNIFGLGINSDDAEPFLGSDFHMPVKWKTGEGVRPGERAKEGMTFALFGDGLILATVEYLGCSRRSHRWEHRPSRTVCATTTAPVGCSISIRTRGRNKRSDARQAVSRTATGTCPSARCSRNSPTDKSASLRAPNARSGVIL